MYWDASCFTGPARPDSFYVVNPLAFRVARVFRLPNDSMWWFRLTWLTAPYDGSIIPCWWALESIILEFLSNRSLLLFDRPSGLFFWYWGINLCSILPSEWNVSLFWFVMLLYRCLSPSVISTFRRLAVSPRYSFYGDTLLPVVYSSAELMMPSRLELGPLCYFIISGESPAAGRYV